MKNLVLVLIFFASSALAQLATQDMGNQQMGSAGALDAQQLQSLLSQQRGMASQNQPQISEAQMKEMMKVLQDYKAKQQERNKALEQLMQEP